MLILQFHGLKILPIDVNLQNGMYHFGMYYPLKYVVPYIVCMRQINVIVSSSISIETISMLKNVILRIFVLVTLDLVLRKKYRNRITLSSSCVSTLSIEYLGDRA